MAHGPSHPRSFHTRSPQLCVVLPCSLAHRARLNNSPVPQHLPCSGTAPLSFFPVVPHYVEACVTITTMCVISRQIRLSSLSPASRPPKSQFPESRGRVRLVCQPLPAPRQRESGTVESTPSRVASQPEARTCSAARPQQEMTRVGGGRSRAQHTRGLEASSKCCLPEPTRAPASPHCGCPRRALAGGWSGSSCLWHSVTMSIRRPRGHLRVRLFDSYWLEPVVSSGPNSNRADPTHLTGQVGTGHLVEEPQRPLPWARAHVLSSLPELTSSTHIPPKGGTRPLAERPLGLVCPFSLILPRRVQGWPQGKEPGSPIVESTGFCPCRENSQLHGSHLTQDSLWPCPC